MTLPPLAGFPVATGLIIGPRSEFTQKLVVAYGDITHVVVAGGDPRRDRLAGHCIFGDSPRVTPRVTHSGTPKERSEFLVNSSG